MPLTRVEDLADTRLAQKISQVPGVGLVSISGGQKPAVRCRPTDRTRLVRPEPRESSQRHCGANVDEAKGNFDGAQQLTPSAPTTSCFRALTIGP